MLTLYFCPGACSTASHVALEETGAPYVEKPIMLPKGEQKTPEYLKINPRGKVPALDVDGTILTENTAILTYLAKKFPEKKLMPTDPFEEARCISTMAWLSNIVHPSYTHYMRPERFAPDAAAQPVVKGDRQENVLDVPAGNRRPARRRTDDGQQLLGRRLLRARVLRLGRARGTAGKRARELHGLQRAHVEAAGGQEGARQRRQRYRQVIH